MLTRLPLRSRFVFIAFTSSESWLTCASPEEAEDFSANCSLMLSISVFIAKTWSNAVGALPFPHCIYYRPDGGIEAGCAGDAADRGPGGSTETEGQF